MLLSKGQSYKYLIILTTYFKEKTQDKNCLPGWEDSPMMDPIESSIGQGRMRVSPGAAGGQHRNESHAASQYMPENRTTISQQCSFIKVLC
ncbi:hypothetical protein CDAR_463471 [Caerostris darwini]|uniref:Uncharacterized protein n=1 Tax=Caerostris darwini TaxID=1538125 RepID=A0AAV4VVQ0_9ARAC|nr:hypothetical protein CDAR_463471 [Caerostris darwini]